MSDPSVSFSRLKDQRSRKRFPDKQISAQVLWPNRRPQCIRPPSIKLHGIKLQHIRPHGARLPSINNLSRDLFLPIRMANTRLTNQGTSLRACLVTQPNNFNFHFTSPKKIKSKTFQLFYTFYITSIIFYYYSNKKTHYKTKLFHVSIKHSQILYHINHLLLLFK
jgi:hypothetical protein